MTGPDSPSTAEDFVCAQTRPTHHPMLPEITLQLADAITPIWTASEDSLTETGIEPPYWAFAWPGGAATARYLLDNPAAVRGRVVYDIAAGSGIAAIAAARAGAQSVSACEIDATARAAIGINAAANGVSITIPEGDPLDAMPPAGAVILAGDVCYQRDMAERMMAWLHRAREGGAEVLLADPGRAYLPQTGLEECARYRVPTSLELEDREMRETVIYRLSDAAS
jgi:predicted nicotinamide N-methyase